MLALQPGKHVGDVLAADGLAHVLILPLRRRARVASMVSFVVILI